MDELLQLQKKGTYKMVERFGGMTIEQLDDFKICTGIESGSTFRHVLTTNPKYCDYVLRHTHKSKDGKSNLALFKHYLTKVMDEAVEKETKNYKTALTLESSEYQFSDEE